MNSKAPIFTRDFVLVCLATFLSSLTHSLVLTAISLLLKQMGFAAGFIGGFLFWGNRIGETSKCSMGGISLAPVA